MSKLTDSQITCIINRFTSKSTKRQHLTQPYQTDSHIIAIDSVHATLFLSNSVTDSTIINEHASSRKEQGSFEIAEYQHITNSKNDPTTFLWLDYSLMQSIVEILKDEQERLTTKETKTQLEYHKRTNRLTISTVETSHKYPIRLENHLRSFFQLNLTKVDNENFSLAIEINRLIDSLLTQMETGEHTTIEFDVFQNDYIKFANDASTIVVTCFRY